MIPTPSSQEIASWPEPNYVNPETRRPLVLGVEIPLLILVVLFTSMRFYSRALIVKALGKDDWFMLAATVTSVATSIMTSISTQRQYQTGYHLWDLTPELAANPAPTGQMAMATQLLFVPITTFTKVSILLTYLRIFPSNGNRYFCYSMIAFVSIWAVSSFLLALLQCKPIQAYWLPSQYPDAECLDIRPLYYITGGLNVFSDFLIFLWPAKDLSQIQISLKQRVTLVSMFSLGIIICVAGICRIWYTSVYTKSADILYNGATLYAIVSIETSIGIICGCLPACKPLLSRLLPRIFPSTHSSTHKSKKASKMDGQSFPFQSLSGGIMKSEAYSVEYGVSRGQSHTAGSSATGRIVDGDGDAISTESEEWIMMQDDLKDVTGQRVKGGL